MSLAGSGKTHGRKPGVLPARSFAGLATRHHNSKTRFDHSQYRYARARRKGTAAAAIQRLALRGPAAWPRDRKRRLACCRRLSASVSDLAVATIQPRHERLWRAAQNGNWGICSLQIWETSREHSIGSGRPIPPGDISFPEMIASVTAQPFSRGTRRRDQIQGQHRIHQSLCQSYRRM